MNKAKFREFAECVAGGDTYFLLQSAICQLSRSFFKTYGVYLDAGCGSGELLKMISEANEEKITQCIGLDSDEEVFHEPYFNGIGKMYNDTIEDFSMSDYAFNLITCVFSLQYLALRDRWEFIEEAFTGLEPGGGLIVVDKVLPNCTSVFQNIYREANTFYDLRTRNDTVKSEKVLAQSYGYILAHESDYDYAFRKAGFNQIGVFFRLFDYVGFIALKGNY